MPHWRLAGSAYFITWRLRPGLPALAPDERDIVAASLEHYHSIRYRLYGYVVMDDHVHCVVSLSAGIELSQLTQTWKSYTARTINKRRGREGSLWQKDSFDRIIRDEDELLEKLQYMLNNPLKRWPGTAVYLWAKWFEL